VCPIGATCSNNCCVPAILTNLCPEGGICNSCPPSGCVTACATNCFLMNLGPCTTLSDCQGKGFPGDVVCSNSFHQCQVLSHLTSCTTSADCPMKGFSCQDKSLFACGSGKVCYPVEQAAQVACAVGHP
jgi:hypothetical protein